MRHPRNHTLAVLCVVLLGAAVLARPAQAQQAARIDSVTPSRAATGQVVTITGIGFGARNVRITVGGLSAQVTSATGSRVTFIVPNGIACGPTVIEATNPGGHTGRIAFLVCGTGNTRPVVNAGPDAVVYLPATATLSGNVTDDGLPAGAMLTIQWSKVSGPGAVTFANASSASTTASFSEAGTYVLRLTATDTEFNATDDATITVYPANQPPVVDAGPDRAIKLPSVAVLDGVVIDDGLPPASTLAIHWSKVSGPGTVTFANAGSAGTTASFSDPGVYVLKLTASDSQFEVTDETAIDVAPANRAPIAAAGDDFSQRVTQTAHLELG